MDQEYEYIEHDSTLLENRMKELNKLENDINIIQAKISRFPERRIYALERLAGNAWVQRTYGRSLINFESFYAKRIRKDLGLCTEELMRLLFKLDQVESSGFAEVKYRRRNLVSRINSDLLPLIDEYLIPAQALVTVYNKVMRVLNQKVEQTFQVKDSENSLDQAKNEQKGKEEMKQETEPSYKVKELPDFVLIEVFLPSNEDSRDIKVEMRGDDIVIIGSNFELPFRINTKKYIIEKAKMKLASTSSLEILLPRRESLIDYSKPAPAPKKKHFPGRSRPEYAIDERENDVLITVLLPENEEAEDLNFSLSYGELVLKGRDFELPFGVNSQKYLPEQAKIKILSSNKVAIFIPKRRYSAYEHLPRNAPKSYHSPFLQTEYPSHEVKSPYFGGFF